MRELNFYKWLFKEEKSSYFQKLSALNNALGLKFNLSDEDSVTSAGNVQLSTLDKDVLDNLKKNTMYMDIKNPEKKTAIDELLNKPNAKVSDLAKLFIEN